MTRCISCGPGWVMAAVVVATLAWSVPTGAQVQSSEAVQADERGAGRAVLSTPRRGRVAAGSGDGMSLDEVEAYVDQLVLRQARVNLALGPQQVQRFGAGLRRLQAVRRDVQRERLALVRDLNQLLAANSIDEAAIAARLQDLDTVARRADDDVRAAYAAIDGVLTVRQRARFRVFEQMMERRKFELLLRARQPPGRSAVSPE